MICHKTMKSCQQKNLNSFEVHQTHQMTHSVRITQPSTLLIVFNPKDYSWMASLHTQAPVYLWQCHLLGDWGHNQRSPSKNHSSRTHPRSLPPTLGRFFKPFQWRRPVRMERIDSNGLQLNDNAMQCFLWWTHFDIINTN